MHDVRRLIWDSLNLSRVAGNQVMAVEVEEVCSGRPVAQLGPDGWLYLVGPTGAGRMLFVVLVPGADGWYSTLTAREASPAESALHERYLGGLQ